ncbi:MAG: M23 family metallopeptidase [Bacteroidales bacterium]|nr:M23 family metallopeptidase [Bacteroidales bacterium]
MKLQKYIFNHKTLSFEKYKRSASSVVGRVLLSVLVFGGFTFLMAFLLYTFFSSPKEKAMARELEYMKLQYEILNDKMDDMQVLLSDMEDRDENVYRVAFEAEPIPRAVRYSGFGGVHRYDSLYGYSNSEIVLNASKKLDLIASRMYALSTSYDEVFDLARNKSEMLASIPAIMPVKEKDLKYISSFFGYRPDPIFNVSKFHSGIDFSANAGVEVVATGDGVVSDVVNTLWGYGKVVEIDHGYGYTTRYAHLKNYSVRKGMRVKRGDKIGTVGRTGKATGDHLHYEVLKNGVQINPLHFFINDLNPDSYQGLLGKSTLPTPPMD